MGERTLSPRFELYPATQTLIEMKHTLLLLSHLLLPLFSFAQSFLEGNKLWYTGKLDWDTEVYTERMVQLDGDTVINNMTYKKLRATYDVVQPQWVSLDTFLREDDQVVYILDPSGQEGILYDFGLSDGESVTLSNGVLAHYVSEEVEIIQGIARRKIKLTVEYTGSNQEFLCDRTVFWYEGIGSRTELFPITCDTVLYHSNIFTAMNCVTLGDDLLYPEGASNWCSFLQTSTRESVPLLFSVSPNPARDLLTIQFPDAPTGRFSIQCYNLNGQVIFQDKINNPTHTIDVSGFSPGIFLLSIHSDDGKSGYVNWVKE